MSRTQLLEIFLAPTRFVRMNFSSDRAESTSYLMMLAIPRDRDSNTIALTQLPKKADKATLRGVERRRHPLQAKTTCCNTHT